MEKINLGDVVTLAIEEGHTLFYYNVRVSSIEEEFYDEKGNYDFVAYGEGVTKKDKELAEEFTSRVDNSTFHERIQSDVNPVHPKPLYIHIVDGLRTENFRKKIEDADFEGDYQDDDTENFDIRKTILFTDLPVSLQKEIKETHYEKGISVEDIESRLFVQQCVAIDTSIEPMEVKHLGYYAYDGEGDIDKRFETEEGCLAASRWMEIIEDKLERIVE